MKTLIHEFVLDVPIRLDTGLTEILKALNKHHYGSETVPYGAEIPPDLLKAAYRVHGTCIKQMNCKVYSDGSFECSI